MKSKSIINRYIFIFLFLFGIVLSAGIFLLRQDANKTSTQSITSQDEVWKEKLTPEQYHVLREGGTDMPIAHLEMLNNHEKGTYVTADCGEPVFRSEQKFDSGTGWPSFWAPIDDGAVELREDNSFGTKRIEVLGKKCGGHLGHVFDDGPEPTGKRYCINASALKFIPDEK